jgi:hypothetical protein
VIWQLNDWNIGARRDSHCVVMANKHVSLAMNNHVKIGELLEALFYVFSVLRIYSDIAKR